MYANVPLKIAAEKIIFLCYLVDFLRRDENPRHLSWSQSNGSNSQVFYSVSTANFCSADDYSSHWAILCVLTYSWVDLTVHFRSQRLLSAAVNLVVTLAAGRSRQNNWSWLYATAFRPYDEWVDSQNLPPRQVFDELSFVVFGFFALGLYSEKSRWEKRRPWKSRFWFFRCGTV